MYSPKLKNSIKSISNINEFYLHLIQVIPRISNKNDYYFILIFEEEIEYKTDTLTIYNDKDIINNKLDININNYLRKNKSTISMIGEYGKDYLIDNITIQDLLFYVLDDTNLFYHDKFNNIYYCYEPYAFNKDNNYYNSIVFTKFFKLRDYIDDVYITINKKKRTYNKKSY